MKKRFRPSAFGMEFGKKLSFLLSGEQIGTLAAILLPDLPDDGGGRVSPDKLWTTWLQYIRGRESWKRAAALQTGILMSMMVFSAECAAGLKPVFSEAIAFRLLEHMGGEQDPDVLQTAMAWCPDTLAMQYQLWFVWRKHLSGSNCNLREVAVRAVIRLDSGLRGSPMAAGLCRDITGGLLTQLATENDIMVLRAVQDWVPALSPPEETAGGGNDSPGLAVGCLWRIWEAHLPGLDPRKRLTAFRAGVSIFNELLAHGKHHSLAEHIGSQLYEYLGVEKHPAIWSSVWEFCAGWQVKDPDIISRLWGFLESQLAADEWMRRELAVRLALQWEERLRSVSGGGWVREQILGQILTYLATVEVEWAWEHIARWSPPDIAWGQRFWEIWEWHLNSGDSRRVELSLQAAIVLVKSLAGWGSDPVAVRLQRRVEWHLRLAMDGCHDWSGWEVLSQWCPSDPGLAVEVWEVWKRHLTEPGLPDWRRQEAAIRAAIRLESTFGGNTSHPFPLLAGLLSDIRATLLQVIGDTANTQLLLVGSRWHPLDKATALRLQELWARRSQTGWPVMDRS